METTKIRYRKDIKSGNELSLLGFGCMRFPRVLGPININKTEELIVSAVERGVNYFDTAYVYAGCEEALGKVLHKNRLRDKVFIATKLPLSKCSRESDFDLFLTEQLKNLYTDHVDYYLMHNLSTTRQWERLRELGIENWISRQKSCGRIGQIGFSFHGEQQSFRSLIDSYDWDICQIQYNYMNTNYQAGTAGLRYAEKAGIPVVVMEPLLGGALANNLPRKARSVFREADNTMSAAEWGLRWLWNDPAITVVLSGMNSMAQLEENTRVAGKDMTHMLTEDELKIYASVGDLLNSVYKIPCTGCNYCMPCPNNVDIPTCFTTYNMSHALGFLSGFIQYTAGTGSMDPAKQHGANSCKKCGACEKRCPQHIPIVKSLDDVKKRMEPIWLKPLISAAKRVRSKEPVRKS